MIAITKVIRAIGRVDKSKGLVIPGPLPLEEDTDVDVIIIPSEYATKEISEEEWMRGLASNPVFDFLKDPKEAIYTFEDGEPYDAQE